MESWLQWRRPAERCIYCGWEVWGVFVEPSTSYRFSGTSRGGKTVGGQITELSKIGIPRVRITRSRRAKTFDNSSRSLLTDPKARKVILVEHPLLPLYIKDIIARILFENHVRTGLVSYNTLLIFG